MAPAATSVSVRRPAPASPPPVASRQAGGPPVSPPAPATQAASARHLLLLNEFDELLPAAAALYGYSADDETTARSFVSVGKPGAMAELEATLMQWRLALVTAQLGDDPKEQQAASLMPPGAARRASIQYRMTVLKETQEIDGTPLTAWLLDWEPEPRIFPVSERFRVPQAPAVPAKSSKRKAKP